jgi:hypothetical protein
MLHTNFEYALTGTGVDEVEVTMSDHDVQGRTSGAIAVLLLRLWLCDAIHGFFLPGFTDASVAVCDHALR